MRMRLASTGSRALPATYSLQMTSSARITPRMVSPPYDWCQFERTVENSGPELVV
ncbi:hypothetical protein BDW66DRAFT_145419 [Aspergillus desertorum]